jgi:hypothetical protein
MHAWQIQGPLLNQSCGEHVVLLRQCAEQVIAQDN